MTFRNIRFPTGIRYGAVMGPAFNTGMARVLSGRTQRNANQEFPLRKFRVERALTSDDLREAFLSFFYNVNGSLDTFRIKDPSDYQVSVTQGVFRALGSGRFQLEKRYSVTSVSETSPQTVYTKDIDIVLPKEDTITITGLTEGVHWTTDYSTPSGIVTAIGSPTPTFSTWSGEYDVLARFEADDLMFVAEDIGLFMSQAIAIIEERP